MSYYKWRKLVLKRDKKTCQVCGKKINLQVHHLFDRTHYPDKKFKVDNGITLCSKCHRVFHTEYKKHFKDKCTKYDFDNFLRIIEYVKGFKCMLKI